MAQSTDVPTGQKCSALSRLYVSAYVWNGSFKDQLLAEIAKIRVGAPQDFGNFIGPVMLVVCPPFAQHSRIDWTFPAAKARTTKSPPTFRKKKMLVVRFSSAEQVRYLLFVPVVYVGSICY